MPAATPLGRDQHFAPREAVSRQGHRHRRQGPAHRRRTIQIRRDHAPASGRTATRSRLSCAGSKPRYRRYQQPKVSLKIRLAGAAGVRPMDGRRASTEGQLQNYFAFPVRSQGRRRQVAPMRRDMSGITRFLCHLRTDDVRMAAFSMQRAKRPPTAKLDLEIEAAIGLEHLLKDHARPTSRHGEIAGIDAQT